MKEIILKIIKNILILVSYFVYEYLTIFILWLFGLDFYELPYNQRVITLFVIQLLYIVLICFLYRKEYKEDIKDFKKNGKKYLKENIKYYALGVIAMGVSNILIQKITDVPISGNEQGIRNLIGVIPLYMAFLSVIYAPIIEEAIFRKSIRNLFKNNVLFVIISGLVFGIVHISDFSDIRQILLGIPYVLMGLDFAYIYYRTRNIFTTMTFHSIHNLILLSIQLIL